MDIQQEEWRSSLPQVETEDEKVRTSPPSWRAAQRAIAGVDRNRHAENVCLTTVKCGQDELDCRRNRAANREAAEARGDEL